MRHTEEYAQQTQDYADKLMDSSANMVANVFSTPIHRIKPSQISQIQNELSLSVALIMKSTSKLGQAEIDQYAPRAFGLTAGFVSAASDFYAKYIPALTGNLTARTMMMIGAKIRKGEQDGLSSNEIAEKVAEGFGLKGGYARVVVRTEGTRAASFSRRAVAYRAAAQGRPPLRFIYKSLMDDRTTQVCKALHNRWWSFDDDLIDRWPPQHFFCRAGVVFDWSDENDLQSYRKLTKSELARAMNLQYKQFPSWVNMSHDILLDPNKTYRELLNVVNGGERTSEFTLNDSMRNQMIDRINEISGGEMKIVKDVKELLKGNRRNSKISSIINQNLKEEIEAENGEQKTRGVVKTR